MAEPQTSPTLLPPKGDPETVYVLDISSFVFRAYYAIKTGLSNSKGEPTNAISGVSQMLMKLISDHEPKKLVVALDPPGGSFRKELYPEYKANRKATPEDLKPQLIRVRELVAALGAPGIERPGFEADDVIAAVVREARAAGLRVVIVSADKDLLQLVGDDVCMFDTMRDRVFGPGETVEKMGVPPEQVRDLLALMGDSSDNVPGVPSVGPKTAVKLLQEHGSLDGIYAAVEGVTRKSLKAKLIEHRELAYLSRDLVTLRDELSIDLDLCSLEYTGVDGVALRRLFTELELSRLLRQLEPEPRAEGHYRTLETMDEVRDACAAIHEAGELSFSIVLDREDPMRADVVGIALSWIEGVAVYLPIGHRYIGGPEMLPQDEVLAELGPLLSNSLLPKRCDDLKRLSVILGRLGVDLRGGRFDTMLASYLLDPARHAHALLDIASAELDLELVPLEALLGKGRGKLQGLDEVEVGQLAGVAAAGADYALRLSHILEPRMAGSELGRLFADLELPLAGVLSKMERVGIRLDAPLLEGLASDASVELLGLETRCHELAGHEFNVGSPRQLEGILFDELHLPVIKKTKTARSTNQQVLEELSAMHELPGAILAHRSLAKLKSTYLDALPREVNAVTGRIHTRYNQAVAATGRLSSSEPNLQNIPIRTALGARIREAFVPREGWEMMSADYSQIELRVLAHISRDAELMDAYTKGEDVHARTATALFGVAAEDVSREMRARAKTVNFAVIYGQTQFALAQNLRIERREAQGYIDAFFERYAGVKRFMEEVVAEAAATGHVTTLLGRRRSIPDMNSPNRNLRNAAERIAQNTPIQGTAADIIKLAMVSIAREMKRRGLSSRMLLSVHDELVFEAPSAEREALSALVREGMEGAIELSVPLTVEMGWGANWGVAH